MLSFQPITYLSQKYTSLPTTKLAGGLALALAITLTGCGTTSHSAILPKASTSANVATSPTIATQTGDSTRELANCPTNFFVQPPQISKTLANSTQALCFNGFAVLYSGVSKTPLWSAENLTSSRVTAAKNMIRVDNFHEENRLPVNYRSLLKNYTQTGFDRGHLSPNGDMGDKDSQFDSFSLANIAPQNPTNNQRTWVKVESKTRDMAQKYGQVYVVTGVAFLGENIQKLKDSVLVPTHFYKAIYVPKLKQATAFISPNDASGIVEQISVSELQNRTGVDVFPALNTTTKNTASSF